MSATFNIIRLFTFVIFTSLASTAFSGSPNASDPPDFSLCDGLMGAAKGLCHAGIAVGCDQEASTACEQIEGQYTAKTGNEPPWADRTINVTSEVSGTVPLDGTWAFECDNEDGIENDENEVLIFLGDTVEAQEILYESKNGTCTGVVEITILATGTVAAFDQFVVSGWINEDDQVSDFAPERNDGMGNLTYQPSVVPLEFDAPGAPFIERTFVYVDDTADPWCFYREYAEDDDNIWGEYLSFGEPRCKQ
jgi:hypothetical protein